MPSDARTVPEPRKAAATWRLPGLPALPPLYFSALDSGTPDHEAFRTLLQRMDGNEPALSEAMRLENVNRWVDGDESGYADLIEAVRWRGS